MTSDPRTLYNAGTEHVGFSPPIRHAVGWRGGVPLGAQSFILMELTTEELLGTFELLLLLLLLRGPMSP